MGKDDLYATRGLLDGHPDLADNQNTKYIESQRERSVSKVPRVLSLLKRLGKAFDEPCPVAVVGCGAKPLGIQDLHQRGYDVIGVEPVQSLREDAEAFLEGAVPILSGTAECLPVDSCSQRIVLLESVIEHVDSVFLSLSECYRILSPGGILYLTTHNRHTFSVSGTNHEYRVPFYNWLPKIVKECYVHKHLHFDPRLANYSQRPAVNWFTYPELCELGRQVGFARFYHKLDLIDRSADSLKRSRMKRFVLERFQRNVWLRTLALNQLGISMIMVKRGLD